MMGRHNLGDEKQFWRSDGGTHLRWWDNGAPETQSY